MNLISKEIINGTVVEFYSGIDFEMAKNHPSDGSKGMIFFFIDDYISEVKSHNRQSKIDSVLNNTNHKEISLSENINNSYIFIYQTSGNTNPIYNTIRNKLIDNPDAIRPIRPIVSF